MESKFINALYLQENHIQKAAVHKT